MTNSQTDSWDRYWAHGFLTSCADAFKGNYEGAMRAFWEKRFAALPDGSRVLDVCTGNGAIALIAAATAREHDRRFEIHAVDLAEIHPERAVDEQARELLDDVHFHPRTDVCATRLEASYFDLVTGHFALEYADREAAIAELDRLTGATGENLFVMHSTESVILATTREELGHINLLTETALLDNAGGFIRLVGNATPAERQLLAGVPEAEQRRTALNEAAGKVSAAIRGAAHPEILRTALGHVSEAYRLLDGPGASEALARLEQGRTEIAANAARLADLVAAASTKKDIEKLGKLYANHGFGEFNVDRLVQDPAGLIGWSVQARRA